MQATCNDFIGLVTFAFVITKASQVRVYTPLAGLSL